MAETLYTMDGQMHVLIGSTTFSELVRSYMGDDAAERVRKLEQGKEKEGLRPYLGREILNRLDAILYRSDNIHFHNYSRRELERDLEGLRAYIFKNI